MTEEEIVRELEQAGFPENKAGLAASRVFDRFFDLCCEHDVLMDESETGELGQKRGLSLDVRHVRQVLLDRSLREVVDSGPERLEESELAQRLTQMLNRNAN